MKRLIDFTLASVGLLMLAPVFACIACGIRLDSRGPVFFRQVRVGRHGHHFRIVKFRTMTIDAEAEGQITVGRDRRITRFGQILRRYKLDELPQLINVVRGEMSVVGPRPEVPKYVDLYPPAVKEIVLSVRPGITDWASLQFRDESTLLGNATDPQRTYVEEILPAKLDCYVKYVNTRSLVMDLKIILLTIAAILGMVK